MINISIIKNSLGGGQNTTLNVCDPELTPKVEKQIALFLKTLFFDDDGPEERGPHHHGAL